MGASLLVRFSEKCIPEPNSGCWLWLAAIGSHGYGVIGTGPHTTATAHRVSWELHKGPIPDGLLVLHRCDVRPCVNPEHLYIGTVADNSRDLMQRGNPYCFKLRSHVDEAARVASLPRGSAHHRSAAKITAETAMQVYLASGTQRSIALRFGICQQQVSHIKTKRDWRHLHGDENL